MPRSKAPIRTPGVPDEPSRDEVADQAVAEGEQLVEGAADLGAVETIAEKEMAPDLRAFIRAEIAKGIADGLKAHARLTASPSSPSTTLPDQSEVNRHAIDRPVLSKQGWVVPAKYGEPTAELKSKT